MVDQATMQRYSSLLSAVLASFGWYFCLKTFNFASTSGIHCFSLPGINNGECSGSAVFLKPGVLQPSYAILIQDGLGWQHPLGLKIWSWNGLIQKYSVNKRILNTGISGIITLSVLPNESKIFHCRIGAMVEERLAPPTDSHFESIFWSRKYKTVYPAKHVNVDISYIYKFK